ncbi:MAG: hypothetical protein K2F59_04470 [Eubacteriales bacterium]|nr:hypothetical protein [Eubacteriales bacterium]
MNISSNLSSFNLYNSNNSLNKNNKFNETLKENSNTIVNIPDEYDKNNDGKWDIKPLTVSVSCASDFRIAYKAYKTDEYPKIIVEIVDENSNNVTFREYIDPTNLDLENISYAEAVAYSAYMYEEGKFDALESIMFTDLIKRDAYPEFYEEGKPYTKEILEKISTGRFNLKNGLKNALSLMFEQGDLTGYYLHSNLGKLVFKYENSDFYNNSKNNINNSKQNNTNKVPYVLI